MDFTNRSAQSAPQSRGGVNSSSMASAPTQVTKKSPRQHQPGWLRIATVGLLFSLTVLVASVASLLYFGNPNESRYLDKTKFQAVSLANDSIYFGKINSITAKTIDLRGIFYLNQQNSASAATPPANGTLSLVKAGCEVHGPEDEMIINRDQVVFWVNLRDNSRVVTTIQKYIQDYPNGQECPKSTQTPTSATNKP